MNKTITSPDQLHEIYQQNLQSILYVAKNILYDEESAKDAAQDVFEKALKQIQTKDIELTNPKGWLLTITKHHCFIIKRNAQKYNSKEFTDEQTAMMQHTSKPQKAEQAILLDKMNLFSIDKFVEENLSARESKIFSLRHYHSYNLNEIAQILRTSPATISRILTKVRRVLKRKFPDVLL